MCFMRHPSRQNKHIPHLRIKQHAAIRPSFSALFVQILTLRPKTEVLFPIFFGVSDAEANLCPPAADHGHAFVRAGMVV